MRLKGILKILKNRSSLIRIVFLLIIFFQFHGSGGRQIFLQPVLSMASTTPKNLDSIRTEGSEKDAAYSKSKISLSGEKALRPVDRLKIPRINVDAALESVGLTADGAMDVPKNPVNAAWFNLGPNPGETGSSVIAGHYGLFDGIPAVFENLHKLRKGDKLSVINKSGKISTFVVREHVSYESEADAKAVFSSSDGKAHLNLITCEGDWDKTSKSYPKRLVVFTDKEY